ncbi:MAG: hypothetical protein EAY70_09770 [Sphingomonadales bacterium]|nr:MAG: hypothetical protein EAY70_09770 [Sphingomonadales bacterium]
MTTHDESSETKTPWVRKVLVPALIGGVVGFAAASGMLRFIDSETVGGLGISGTIAALVGVLYVVIGASIALGTASPQLGARFLNVEDADELREQKQVLTLSGTAMGVWGASLLALALAAPDGPLPHGIALAIGAGGLVIGCLLSVPIYRACDELMRMANLEAGAITYGLVLLVVGTWAMLAHLGYIAGPAPIDLLTLFYVLVLVASFIAVGRRGMLTLR